MNYFKSKLIYFDKPESQSRVKKKHESEVSCHITMISVISGLFHTSSFTTLVSS